MTGSTGASYRWHDNLFTADLIYGGGLRAGDLSDGAAPHCIDPYAVVNIEKNISSTGFPQDFHN